MTKEKKLKELSKRMMERGESINRRKCNIRGIPMKNSNQYDFAMASLNCLTFAASSSIVQAVVLSTFSTQRNGHIDISSKAYLTNEV